MRILLGLTLVVFLSGCATPTPYQPTGFMGGYSETRLGENIFQVSFRGNGFTRTERAIDFSLLRAAELTLTNGYRYFVIITSEKGTQVGAVTTPSTSQTTGGAYSSGNYAYGTATTTTFGGQTFIISKPRVTNTILCFKEKPQIDGLVFDAEFVEKSIREKYSLRK